MKRSRSISLHCANVRPRRSPRLLALARSNACATKLLDLPDEALAQIYRHILLYTNDHHNTFHNLRNGFALASTCHRLHDIFFSSIHTFDATRIFPPYNFTRRSCQCRMCGHVCVSPARAIISRAAPNLRVLGIPDVLSMSILTYVAGNCTYLRQISFTDDGLFTFARQPTKDGFKKVLKLPHLRTLIVQAPTPSLIHELTKSETKLAHVSFYGAQRQHIPQLVNFVERGDHNLETFLVSFGSIDYIMSAEMYSPSSANGVEIMNASTSTLPRSLISDILVSLVSHYLRLLPLRCLYVSTLDEDMRVGRCDNARQRPRHCLIRRAMRRRCSGFHDNTPEIRDMDVQRPICHATIFDVYTSGRQHSTAMCKYIEPPLLDGNLYCLWHNECATIRFDSKAPKSSNSCTFGSGRSIRNSNRQLVPHEASNTSGALTTTGPPRQRLLNRLPKYMPIRQGIQAAEVVCTVLRKLALQGCECDLWRFDNLPCLHALEISADCAGELKRLECRERTLRMVKQAATLRRVHVNWFYEATGTEHGFDLVTEVLESATGLTMLDLSTSFIVMAIENRKMISMFTHASGLRVLHIGCCSHLTSSAMCFPPPSATSAAGESGTGSGSHSATTGAVAATTTPHGASRGSMSSLVSGLTATATECHSNISLSRFVAVVPRLLKLIARWCDHIRRIDLHVENHWIDMGREVDAQQFGKVCRWALKALEEYESSMPFVDVSSLKTQLRFWSSEATRKYRSSAPKPVC